MSLLDNNIYWIKSIHSGKCLDVCQQKGKKLGTTIIHQYFNYPNQQFMLQKLQQNSKTKTYLLISNQTGKALTIQGNPDSNGSLIRQAQNTKADHQKWRLLETDVNSGEYVIAAYLSDKVMDVCHEKKSDGSMVFLYDYKKSHNQIWQFILADDGDYPLKGMGCKKGGLVNHSCFFFTKDSL